MAAREQAMARRRRMFGPLFYGTVVISIPLLLYVANLKVEEKLAAANGATAVLDPDEVIRRCAPQLQEARWETRSAATVELGDLLRKMGPEHTNQGAWAQTVKALRAALTDRTALVREQAADALGAFAQSAQPARAELMAALDDEDSTVRFAAAKALIRAGDALVGPAIEAMARMLPNHDLGTRYERREIVAAMMVMGEAGKAAAMKAIREMLASRDTEIRRAAVDCLHPTGVDSVDSSPLLEQALKDDDFDVRSAAAVVMLELGPATAAQRSLALAVQERAVADPSLSLTVRQNVLSHLERKAPRALRKCGLELARQLSHEDWQVRLDAAKLLHSIDDKLLAGPPDGLEGAEP